MPNNSKAPTQVSLPVRLVQIAAFVGLLILIIFTSISGNPFSAIPPSDSTPAELVNSALWLIIAWVLFGFVIVILLWALFLSVILSIIRALFYK